MRSATSPATISQSSGEDGYSDLGDAEVTGVQVGDYQRRLADGSAPILDLPP